VNFDYPKDGSGPSFSIVVEIRYTFTGTAVADVEVSSPQAYAARFVDGAVMLGGKLTNLPFTSYMLQPISCYSGPNLVVQIQNCTVNETSIVNLSRIGLEKLLTEHPAGAAPLLIKLTAQSGDSFELELNPAELRIALRKFDAAVAAYREEPRPSVQ
jgi:hypothetical protein